MNINTRKAMVFIAVGILAAAAIGVIVWRVSTPSPPSAAARSQHSTAEETSAVDKTTSAPTTTKSGEQEETATHRDAAAPEALAAQQREEHEDASTLLRAKPTKIYRPDSISAQDLGKDSGNGGENTALAAAPRETADAPVAQRSEAPQPPAEPAAPTTRTPVTPPSENVTPTPDEPSGYGPSLSEAIEQAQEEISKLPGISELPIPSLPLGEENNPTSEEQEEQGGLRRVPEDAEVPTEPRATDDPAPATSEPAAGNSGNSEEPAASEAALPSALFSARRD
ncbi:hypothetical protein [Corynebacterium lowii]|uniref:Uncharacterized protein n=1 Tax=Corynebacterium lowii TaxID=1544413 RepID=A0A0Q0UGL6_9CORY|nr:hypothetical protein [Corynebacterium lowii]KQB87543.1 hypothetical protein Clow_00602 [Corynebacterium lowii]MDP9851862.1 hypothetical protein [Corynebacterium lowii]